MRVIITILDGITETSMGFNEFVLYRAKHYLDETPILIICNSQKSLPQVDIPDNLRIIYAGKNVFHIRKVIKGVIRECEKKGLSYMFHLHMVQSGLLSEVAMLGTGFRKKVLFTVHSTFSGYKFHNKILSFLNSLFAERITCVSKTSYRDYPGIIKKIKKSRIVSIQNGVDTKRIDDILEHEINSEYRATVDFIYVARMVPIKNHKFLIEVLKRTNKNIRFIFVGLEDPNGEIRKLAKAYKVDDRVVFTGLIPRNEVFERLAQADAYISSSVLEGLPISVLEAMYCSLPCFLSDIPQHKEIKKRTDEAVKILPLSVKSWTEELNKFSGLSKEKRIGLGKRNRVNVKKYFTLEQMHRKYDELYNIFLDSQCEG